MKAILCTGQDYDKETLEPWAKAIESRILAVEPDLIIVRSSPKGTDTLVERIASGQAIECHAALYPRHHGRKGHEIVVARMVSALVAKRMAEWDCSLEQFYDEPLDYTTWTTAIYERVRSFDHDGHAIPAFVTGSDGVTRQVAVVLRSEGATVE